MSQICGAGSRLVAQRRATPWACRIVSVASAFPAGPQVAFPSRGGEVSRKQLGQP